MGSPSLLTRMRRFAFGSSLPKLMPDLNEFMTAKEAAQELDFTVQGIRKLVRNSKLEALSVGRMYLISKKSIKEYIDKTSGMGKNDPTRGKALEGQKTSADT